MLLNEQLNKSQKEFYKKVLSIIKSYSIAELSFLENPITYILEATKRYIFNKQNTIHEASVFITEEVRNLLITDKISFDEFIVIEAAFDRHFKEESQVDGVLSLSILTTRLLKSISKKLVRDNMSALSLPSIDKVLNGNVTIKSNFDFGNIHYYIKFLEKFTTNSNKHSFLMEARIILSKKCILTTHNMVLRALAYAIIIINDKKKLNTEKELFRVEFETCISFNATAITPRIRENVLETIDEDYESAHNNWYTAKRYVTFFNSRLSEIFTFAYVAAIISIFLTRVYSGSAHERFKEDISSLLNIILANRTLTNCTLQNSTLTNCTLQNSTLTNCTLQNSTLTNYTLQNSTLLNGILLNGIFNISFNATETYAHYTYSYTHSNCTTGNSTGINNITIFTPEHPSEYFPEHAGLYNGMPSYATTIMSTIQLFFTLPLIFIVTHGKKFSLSYHKKYNPTIEQKRAKNSFLAVTVFRWIANVIMQPIDVVTSEEKNSFFQWTVFRFFTPTACIEEPLKLQILSDSIQRYSYRNKSKRFLVNLKLMYLSSLLITALEFLDKALKFPCTPLSVTLKFSRALSVITPIIHNKHYNRVIYSRSFTRFAIANLLRTLTSPAILPLYDLLGSKLRYASLLSAVDVISTVVADAEAANIMYKANIIEESLLAIEDIIDAAITKNKNASLILLSTNIEKQLLTLRYKINIKEILETGELDTDSDLDTDLAVEVKIDTSPSTSKITPKKSTSSSEKLSLFPKVTLDFSMYDNLRKCNSKCIKGSKEENEPESSNVQKISITDQPPILTEITEEEANNIIREQSFKKNSTTSQGRDFNKVVIAHPNSSIEEPLVQPSAVSVYTNVTIV